MAPIILNAETLHYVPIDFAYTLQGWLKATNGDHPSKAKDIGGDAWATSATMPDLWKGSLNYYLGDYTPIGATDNTGATGSTMLTMPDPVANRGLYNGNIAAASALPGYLPGLFTDYRYDKLNRIRAASYRTPDYSQTTPIPATGPAPNPLAISGPTGYGVDSLYKSSYHYDLDGNLTKLTRRGLMGTTDFGMDNLTYFYQSGTITAGLSNNNILTNYTDSASHSTLSPDFTNDIATHTAAAPASEMRLTYDPIGNLTKDIPNGIDTIKWTLYGKVAEADKADSSLLKFTYDPLGNRWEKSVTRYIPDSAKYQALNEYYIRDAAGNQLAAYRQQKRWHYEDIYPVILRGAAPSPAFGNGLTPVIGGNVQFSAALIGNTVKQQPSWAEARTAAHPVSFYMDNDEPTREAIILNTPNLIGDLLAHNHQLVPGVSVNDEGYNPDLLSPFFTPAANLPSGRLSSAPDLEKGANIGAEKTLGAPLKYSIINSKTHETNISYRGIHIIAPKSDKEIDAQHKQIIMKKIIFTLIILLSFKSSFCQIGTMYYDNSNSLSALRERFIQSCADSINRYDELRIVPNSLLNPCFDHQIFYWESLHSPDTLRMKVLARVTNLKSLKLLINLDLPQFNHACNNSDAEFVLIRYHDRPLLFLLMRRYLQLLNWW